MFWDSAADLRAIESPAHRAPPSLERIKEFKRAIHFWVCSEGVRSSARRVDKIYGKWTTACVSEAKCIWSKVLSGCQASMMQSGEQECQSLSAWYLGTSWRIAAEETCKFGSEIPDHPTWERVATMDSMIAVLSSVTSLLFSPIYHLCLGSTLTIYSL